MKKLAVRNIRLCTKDCLCLYVCPTGATDTENSVIDPAKCIGCGVCAEACPSGALKMAGREALVLTPGEAMLEATAASGCKSVAVWAPQEARSAYEHVAQALTPQMKVTVVSTTGNGLLRPAFRDMLRIFRTMNPNVTLDAVLLDSFTADLTELAAELEHVHRQITEEDMAFDRILSPTFRFIEPNACLTAALYRLLREKNLFTHDIAFPSVRYYQTEENRDGDFVPVEVSAAYVSSHVNPAPYVPDFD